MRFGQLVLLLVLLVAGVSVSAQQSAQPRSITPPPWTPHVVRDPDALKLVQASITALGGAEAIGQVQTCIVHGNLEGAPDAPTPSGTLVWEISGIETKSTLTSGNVINSQSTGNGQPYRVINGTAQKAPPHIVRASFFPALVSVTLLREFQNPNYSAQYLGETTIGSVNAAIIRLSSQASVTDIEVTPQVWYFDLATNLPLRVEYRFPDDRFPRRFVPAAADLSAYQVISGVMFPLQSALTVSGNPYAVVTVSSVVPNGNIPATEFAAPAGGLQ